jgi:hypothetical protein
MGEVEEKLLSVRRIGAASRSRQIRVLCCIKAKVRVVTSTSIGREEVVGAGVEPMDSKVRRNWARISHHLEGKAMSAVETLNLLSLATNAPCGR